jgi:competence protein ComEC
MRAVTMFTFVALAEPLSKRANIYNTLALSAFCLLLYNPYFIMSVGFQLSYLAVLGIVYLYPRLFIIWTPSSWVMGQVWKITSVSLSAQLATFSLGLLYFHQFPVYFLITNLFVIPLAFIVLVSGLLMICVSFIPAVGSVIGGILTYAIKLLNGVVLITESLPGSLIKGVHLTTIQCYLLIAIVISFIVMFRFRKFALLYVAMFLASWFSIIGWNHWKSAQKAKMIVYNVRGRSAVDIIDKGQVYDFSDSVLREQPTLGDFQMKSNRIAHSGSEVMDTGNDSYTRNFSGGRLIQWNNVVMMQISDKNFSITENLSVDYLVISNNSLRNLDEVINMIDAHHIIIDSSNSMYVADNLIKEANELNRPAHSVLREGAFVTEL